MELMTDLPGLLSLTNFLAVIKKVDVFTLASRRECDIYDNICLASLFLLVTALVFSACNFVGSIFNF